MESYVKICLHLVLINSVHIIKMIVKILEYISICFSTGVILL